MKFDTFLRGKFGWMKLHGADAVGLKRTTFCHPSLRTLTSFVMGPFSELIQDDAFGWSGIDWRLQIAVFV